MSRKLYEIIAIVLVTIVLVTTSCRSTKEISRSSSEYTSVDSTIAKIKIKIDTFRIKGDSAYRIIKIDCDSLRQANIRSNGIDGDRTHIHLMNMGNNTYAVKCNSDSLHSIIISRDSFIYSLKTKLNAKASSEFKKITKYPWWMYPSYILIGFLSFVLSYFLLKFKIIS